LYYLTNGIGFPQAFLWLNSFLFETRRKTIAKLLGIWYNLFNIETQKESLMENRVRILGIAPYEGMKTLMASLAEEYPQIDLTLFVGDMEQGVEIAKNNFHGDYDVVISRGGTAKMLKTLVPIPLVEIEISMYDLLCALKLAGGLTERTAIVSFSNTAVDTKTLCELLGCQVDLYPVEDANEVEPIMQQVKQKQYGAVLCDMIANNAAKRLSMNSYLLTSGIESIRRAFDHALLLCEAREQLRDENSFFREVIRGQIGQTVVFDKAGNLFFSTLEEPAPALMELLRRELPECRTETERRITRNLDGMVYSIRARQITVGRLSHVAFFFAAHRTPLSSSQIGVRFLSNAEVEALFYNSIFCFAGIIGEFQDDIIRINQSSAPLMVSGKDGTGKESVVCAVYLRSTSQNNALVSIDCSLVNDKTWTFLLEHHNSPLSDEGNTLYFSSIDSLPPDRRRQLLAALSEMEVFRRNRVIFSCACRRGESISAVGSEFMDALCCLSIRLPPLRELADRIPPLINLTLSHLNADLPRQILGAEPDAMVLLQEFQWPHNYTQFRRVMGDLAVTAKGQIITTEDVRVLLNRERHVGAVRPDAENSAAPLDLNRPLEEIQQDIARRVLEETGGNQTAAAKRLGIGRTTLWRLLQKG
jgi:transcriptional regulator with PAS, ATPase and Fis domain